MMISLHNVCMLAMLAMSFISNDCRAFTSPTASSSMVTSTTCSRSTTSKDSTLLHQSSSEESNSGDGGGLFGRRFSGGGRAAGGILSGLFGGPIQQQQPSGPQVVLDLAATNVKVGAMRFLLQIYLVGEQNKPTPKSWFIKQGDNDGSLQMYFRDGTGMLSINLSEYQIQATRHGEQPSLAYQLQESVMLHGILDELNGVAFNVDETIPEEKRLLRFSNPAVLQDARSKLPAKSA